MVSRPPERLPASQLPPHLKPPPPRADEKPMKLLRWLLVILLVWGLFTGIGYVLSPLLTERWGNNTSTVVGLGLIVLCTAGLLRLDPRRR